MLQVIENKSKQFCLFKSFVRSQRKEFNKNLKNIYLNMYQNKLYPWLQSEEAPKIKKNFIIGSVIIIIHQSVNPLEYKVI